MKKIITIICLFFSTLLYAQLPDSVSHVEIVSELADTMVLVNKTDVDIINTAFQQLEYADSLNEINNQIISAVNTENEKLENIVSEQEIIISNKDLQIENIKKQNKEVISDLETQVKRANRKKTFWGCTTGAGIIAIIFLSIFK